jgi:hypothetical protein
MSKPVVLIIDKKSDRSQAMALSFPVNVTAIETWKDTVEGHIRVSNDDTLPTDCLLRLWHLGDYENADPSWLAVQAKLTVFYGGNGGHDGRCPDGAEIVWRPIVREEEALTPEEASQLLTYANDRTQKPKFLQKPQGCDTLAALAILCQGYLSVYAANGQPQCSEIMRALSLMGWDSSKHALLVNEELQHVQNPQWWLEVFGISVDTKAAGTPSFKMVGWTELSNLLALEWGPGVETFLALPLVDCLRRARPLSDARIVAEAYLKIAERFKPRTP